MIRFKPDDWMDWLMRPFDIVSPEANIYVEIPAPDVRYAVVVVLAVALLLFRLFRKHPAAQSWRGPMALLVVTLAATGAWLGTSGNGRYFVPVLLMLGPLAVGLVRLLPVSRGFQLTTVGLIIGLQGFVVMQSPPWNTWAWLRWADTGYFHLDKVPQDRQVTYVTVTNISYSLIAPLFPQDARWANLTVLGKREAPALHSLIGASREMRLVLPTLPSQTDARGQPSAGVRHAVDGMLLQHGLSLNGECRLSRSRSVAAILRREMPDDAGEGVPVGFWLCPLQARAPSTEPTDAAGAELDDIFSSIERLCPRFFPPGTAVTAKVEGAFARMYSEADTKLYVLEDGRVLYKFWRSLNPVLVGTVNGIRASGAQIDCGQIRAPNWRSGGP